MSKNSTSNDMPNDSQTSSGGSGREHGDNPVIVEGHQHHQYTQNSDRYVYIGKDMSSDGRTPAFLDYGKKTK
jgi:hypothetical protein